jgi:hypothetical protein
VLALALAGCNSILDIPEPKDRPAAVSKCPGSSDCSTADAAMSDAPLDQGTQASPDGGAMMSEAGILADCNGQKEGFLFCSANNVMRCAPGLAAADIVQTCAGASAICRMGACVECFDPPPSDLCINNAPRSCTDGGQWVSQSACNNGICNNGACTATCASGITYNESALAPFLAPDGGLPTF